MQVTSGSLNKGLHTTVNRLVNQEKGGASSEILQIADAYFLELAVMVHSRAGRTMPHLGFCLVVRW